MVNQVFHPRGNPHKKPPINLQTEASFGNGQGDSEGLYGRKGINCDEDQKNNQRGKWKKKRREIGVNPPNTRDENWPDAQLSLAASINGREDGGNHSEKNRGGEESILKIHPKLNFQRR